MENVIYERTPAGYTFGHSQEHFFGDTKKASLKARICSSPIVKLVIPGTGLVVLVMAAVYLTMYFVLKKSDEEWPATCNIRPSYQIECFPGRNDTSPVTFEECTSVGCCWLEETKFCYHSIPSRHGYRPGDSDSYKENDILVPRKSKSPLGSENAETLVVQVSHSSANHVRITLRPSGATARGRANLQSGPPRKEIISSAETESDELSKRLLYYLPDNPMRRTTNSRNDPMSNMRVYFHSPEFSFTVTSQNDTDPLLTTARGPLILTDSFWELTLFITNETLYGLNELQLNGTTNLIYNYANGTKSPGFLGIDKSGRATACYINYNGPMEVKVLDESNLIVLRGLSLPRDISVDVFAGSTPLDAITLLTKYFQRESHVQDAPISSLGLHICPDDDSIQFIDSLKSTIQSMTSKGVPWDSHCIHQGFNPTLGETLNGTHSAVLAEAIQILNGDGTNENRVLVPHLSPMVHEECDFAKQLANESLLLRSANSKVPYVGSYRNRNVVYPDWLEEKTLQESLSSLTHYLNEVASSRFFYVRDSWPKDETTGHAIPKNNEFDYMPKGMTRLMSNGTLPYNVLTSSGRNSHYAEHNGFSEKFRNASTLKGWSSLGLRGLLSGSGNSSWAALEAVIRTGVASALVGQLPPPMYVCGTGEDLSAADNRDELCSRWYGAAVAWPHVVARPANLPGGEHLSASASGYAVKHLKLRASLLTYTRTKLAEYHSQGLPLLAPTAIYYPKDAGAPDRWNQFLWGDSILVGLVTLPGVSQVSMWLPGKYPWRHMRGGAQVSPSSSKHTSITAAEGQIVALLRPGYIVPLHNDISMTSSETSVSQLTLVANFACEKDCHAKGRIFYGDAQGEFLSIIASNTTVELSNIRKVQAVACVSSVPKHQATFIKNVEILGNRPQVIDTELCTIEADSHTIQLN